MAVVEMDLAKPDVGQIAKKVANAQSPHKTKHPPGASVVLDVPNLTDQNAGNVTGALARVAGVDAKKSGTDMKAKQVTVKLSATGEAKLADIKKAVSEAIKPPETTESPPSNP